MPFGINIKCGEKCVLHPGCMMQAMVHCFIEDACLKCLPVVLCLPGAAENDSLVAFAISFY